MVNLDLCCITLGITNTWHFFAYMLLLVSAKMFVLWSKWSFVGLLSFGGVSTMLGY